jgi:hypothetical protein
VHPGCQKSHRSNKARSMGFCHACDTLQLSRISVSALHCCTGRNLLATRHAIQKKTPMSWKHPPSTPANKFKATCVGKEYHGNCVLRGYAVTAECCGKLGRLPETIPCQTPGLLCPDGVILYDVRLRNATCTCTLLRCDSWKVIEHPLHFRSRAQRFSSLWNS